MSAPSVFFGLLVFMFAGAMAGNMYASDDRQERFARSRTLWIATAVAAMALIVSVFAKDIGS